MDDGCPAVSTRQVGSSPVEAPHPNGGQGLVLEVSWNRATPKIIIHLLMGFSMESTIQLLRISPFMEISIY